MTWTFLCVCLRNIIILVLFIFILNFHFEQKSYKRSRPFCNSSWLLAKITMPSINNTWTMGRCIVCTEIRLLVLIRLFISSFFFLSNFQTLNIFVTLFSATVRPRRLKHGTHVDSGQMYPVYRNQAAGFIRPFISSFFFLSNFQTLKFFLTLFSGTVRPRRLKLGTHVDSGQMYHVYRNQHAVLIHPFISSFFFLSNFQTFKFFVTLFSETV